MNVPKWLIPVLAVIAAAAVAVAATLFATRFAPVETIASPPETQIVPVLAPIATGDEPPAVAPAEGTPEAEDEGAGLIVSGAVAEREVAVPLSGDADEATFHYFMGLLGEWPDVLFGLINLDGDSRADGDDPCSPAEGDPPADCPEGLRGAIFSDTALRDFAAGGQAYPPTYDEYLAEGNPYGGALWCDGLTPADGEVPFGILATAPGSFTVTYWPTGDTGSSHRVSVETSADAEAAWHEQVALGDEGFPIVQQCLTLPDIEPGTAYTALVMGTDIFDRRSPWHTTRFHSSGEPVHPGLQIATVGDNLVFASALGRDDETVDIRAVAVEPGTAPSCDAADTAAYSPLTQTVVRAAPDEVAAVNAEPGFRNKSVVTYAIPEGSTTVVCARWFPAGDAPSWESAQQTFESAVVVQAPDRLGPLLRLEEVDTFTEQLDRLEFTVSSASGAYCGSATWFPESDPAPELTLCSPGGLATGGTTADGADRLSTRGFDGDLVVEVAAQLTSGDSSTTSYLIPAGDGACRGLCELPERAWYRVALADIDQVTGLCGTFFGSDCEPPTTRVAVGTATLSLEWEQGDVNGLTDWLVGPAADLPRDYVAPDHAQIDVDDADGGWTLTDPSVATPSSDATLEVAVDRPVDYRVTLTNAYGEGAELGVASPGCRSGAPLEATGSTTSLGGEHTLRASIPGLCLGVTYYAQLELTDESGRTTVWSVDRETSASWWGGSIVTAPRLLVDLVYDFRSQSFTRSYLYVFEIEYNNRNLNATDARSGRCLADGITESHGRVDGVSMYLDNQVTVELRITAARRWGDADAWDAECLADPTDEPLDVVTFDVTHEQLLDPYGVVLTSNEGYPIELVLHGYNPRPEPRL
jgi:hypothetical protein